MGDLNRRRGQIQGWNQEVLYVLLMHCPLENMFGYSTDMNPFIGSCRLFNDTFIRASAPESCSRDR